MLVSAAPDCFLEAFQPEYGVSTDAPRVLWERALAVPA